MKAKRINEDELLRLSVKDNIMQEQIKQIGARIRELREISDMSPAELAEATNIPIDQYKVYENGEADIPVGILYRIANALKVELSTLLTGENPRLHMYSIVRKGKGISVERRKEYHHESLAFNFAHKKAEPFLVTVQPEADDTPIAHNSHPGQEFNYVLQGTLKVVIDGHEIELHEGDSLYFDASYEHGMKAMNHAPAQFLAIIF